MTVGRDPVERVLDVIVFAPIGVAIVTRDAVPLLARVARRSIGAAVVGVVGAGAEALAAHRERGRPQPAASTSADVAPLPGATADLLGADAGAEAGGAGSGPRAGSDRVAGALAIDDYDHLAARQVVDRLDQLTIEERAAIAAYERAHRHRRTVLGKIEQLAR